MYKLILSILMISLADDCWRPVVINAKYTYAVKDEGKSFKPLHSYNEEIINSDLIIDGDTTRKIRMVYFSAFPMGDTVKIEIFDNEESYAHSFNIVIFKNQYFIRYGREINFTDLVQKFEPVKTKLELNSSDFSKGSKIRGHIEYIGKCVSGCTDKNKRIKIEGNFAVKIHRY